MTVLLGEVNDLVFTLIPVEVAVVHGTDWCAGLSRRLFARSGHQWVAWWASQPTSQTWRTRVTSFTGLSGLFPKALLQRLRAMTRPTASHHKLVKFADNGTGLGGPPVAAAAAAGCRLSAALPLSGCQRGPTEVHTGWRATVSSSSLLSSSSLSHSSSSASASCLKMAAMPNFVQRSAAPAVVAARSWRQSSRHSSGWRRVDRRPGCAWWSYWP